jgi:hypothetical protein
MKHNKPPGLNGFPAEFYQNFCELIKSDLLEFLLLSMANNLICFALILVRSPYCQNLMKRKGFSSLCRFVFLMCASRKLKLLG